MNIDSSEWAINIKKYCADLYDTFISVAENPELVVNVFKLKDSGWAIEARNIIPDFYLDICFTKDEAIDLCNKMNWKIR